MSKHGENIRKRKDGRWEGRYIKGRKADKTAVWGYIYGHSYTEVKEKLIRKKNEVRQFALETYNPTFSELSLSWESSIFLGVKASTAAHYHYTLQHYILPVLGDYRIQVIDERILESSLLEIISPTDGTHKTLGCTMSKECVTLVRRICRYASHLHLMRPIEICLKLPAQKSVATTVLSHQEQKSVCTYVLSDPTPRRIGTLLMMQMGLRIGEVCGLQWGDIDLQNGALSVRRTIKRIYIEDGKTSLVIQSPKTTSSERIIPIPQSVLHLLKEVRMSQGNDTWFLSGNSERPVEPRCYYKSLQGYLKHAGVPALRPHALRHTFATTCLQAGCNVKTLSELMGHASPDVTLKRYAHSCWEWKREEIDAVYVITKNTAIEFMKHYYAEYGLKYFVFRFPTIYNYSPYHYYHPNGVKTLRPVYRMIDQAMKGEPIELWGDPNYAKDMVHVYDCAQMICKAVEVNRDHGWYNVGTGIPVTLQQQIETIIKVFSPADHPSQIVYRPDKPAGGGFLMDITNAKEELGYEPKYDVEALFRNYKEEMEINRFKELRGE